MELGFFYLVVEVRFCGRNYIIVKTGAFILPRPSVGNIISPHINRVHIALMYERTRCYYFATAKFIIGKRCPISTA